MDLEGPYCKTNDQYYMILLIYSYLKDTRLLSHICVEIISSSCGFALLIVIIWWVEVLNLHIYILASSYLSIKFSLYIYFISDKINLILMMTAQKGRDLNPKMSEGPFWAFCLGILSLSICLWNKAFKRSLINILSHLNFVVVLVKIFSIFLVLVSL